MSVRIAESPMQTRSSRRELAHLTRRGLLSSTRGPATPMGAGRGGGYTLSPQSDVLSSSTTLRNTISGPGSLSVAPFTEECGVLRDDLPSLGFVAGAGAGPLDASAQGELKCIAVNISRSAVAANMAAIGAQRKQVLVIGKETSRKGELLPLPAGNSKLGGEQEDSILLLMLQVMVQLGAEPAASVWLEQHINLLYTSVFALLRDRALMIAWQKTYNTMMDLLKIYLERIEGKLTTASQDLDSGGGGNARRRKVDLFLWRVREQLLALCENAPGGGKGCIRMMTWRWCW